MAAPHPLIGEILAQSRAPEEQPPRVGPSAAELLDELLGRSPVEGLSAEELRRLRVVQDNQEKSARILRALHELLVEKGALQQPARTARPRSS